MKGIIAASAVCLLAFTAAALFVYDTVKESSWQSVPVYSEYKEEKESYSVSAQTYVSAFSAYADVPQIMQLPDLPTGCECTSLTMVLRAAGTNADKTDISRNYLIKDKIYKDEEGNLHGPDFFNVFGGDPEDDASYGCLAPCITETAGKYLKENKYEGLYAEDISGTDFYMLFSYIENGIPVIIWSTQGLKIPKYNTSWKTSDGKSVIWPSNEHCVVLSGYSYTDNTVRINDPLDGEQMLSMEKVKKCYDLMGQNAVIINKR